MLAAMGVMAGVAIGAAAQASGPARTSRAPSVSVAPSTCFVGRSTCSIHPCVEFVATAPIPRSRQVLQPRTRCEAYPSTPVRTLFIQR